MGQPILACCNFIPDAGQLRDFALTHGFAGVDWTFKLENFPHYSSALALPTGFFITPLRDHLEHHPADTSRIVIGRTPEFRASGTGRLQTSGDRSSPREKVLEARGK